MGTAIVTSEKRFAQSNAAFWNALLPMEEPYIRAHNASLKRFAPAIHSVVSADQRGMINEFAFHLFVAGVKRSVLPTDLPTETVARCAEEAISYMTHLAGVSRMPKALLTQSGASEAQTLAMALSSYFRWYQSDALLTRPFFRGCGWLDDAEGDVLADTTLVEVKAGDRLFRGIDLRQLLCYCALNFSAKSYEIDNICLLNPRSGTYFTDGLEHLCQQTAGTSATKVLGEIVGYVSEPFGDVRSDSLGLE